MGYFGNLTYADSSKRKFVGLPLNTLLEVGKNLQARYDAAEEGMNQYKLLESSLNVEDEDRVTLKGLIQEAQSKFDSFIQAGNLWDMGSIVKQEATRLITDPRIKASIEDKQIRSAFESDISKSEEYNLGTKNYAIAQSRSMVKMKEVDPITGVVTNRYSTPSIIKDIDQTKIGENIAKLLKDNPSMLSNKTLRDVGNYYLSYGNLEGITPEQLSEAYNAYIDAMPNSEAYKKQLANVALFNSGFAEFNDGELEYKASSISEYYNTFSITPPTNETEALLNPLLLQTGLVKVERNLDKNGAVIQKSNIPGGVKGIKYSWDDAALKELGIESEDLYSNIHEFNTNITEKIGKLLANIELGKGAKYASTFAFVKDNSTLYQNIAAKAELDYKYALKLKAEDKKTGVNTDDMIPGAWHLLGEGSDKVVNDLNELARYKSDIKNKLILDAYNLLGHVPKLAFDSKGNIDLSNSEDLSRLPKNMRASIGKFLNAHNYNSYIQSAENMKIIQDRSKDVLKQYINTNEGKARIAKGRILYNNLTDKQFVDKIVNEYIELNSGGPTEARARMFFRSLDIQGRNIVHLASEYANENQINSAKNLIKTNGAEKTYTFIKNTLLKKSSDYRLLGSDRTLFDIQQQYPETDYNYEVGAIGDDGTISLHLTLDPKSTLDTKDKTLNIIINAPDLVRNTSDDIVREALVTSTGDNDWWDRPLFYSGEPSQIKSTGVRKLYESRQREEANNRLASNSFSFAINDVLDNNKNQFSLSMQTYSNAILPAYFSIEEQFNRDENNNNIGTTGNSKVFLDLRPYYENNLLTKTDKSKDKLEILTTSNNPTDQEKYDLIQQSVIELYKLIYQEQADYMNIILNNY